jgi:hypothetical protein
LKYKQYAGALTFKRPTMSDDSTRNWFRAVIRHAILESIAVNALVTSVVLAASSQYSGLSKAFPRLNLHVDTTRPWAILAMLTTILVPSICCVAVAVGRAERERRRLLQLVVRGVRSTEPELLATIRERVAARLRSERAA